MKRLVVTADDFGLAVEVNAAIEQAHRDGILSAASLMVGAPAAADAVARARRLPGLRVGLHVVLLESRPVLSRDQVPDLVDADGQFRSDMVRLAFEIFGVPRVRNQMRAEVAAQFSAFRETGLTLDHVNAHKHFHLHPTILSVVMEEARKAGVTGLRLPVEPAAIVDACGQGASPSGARATAGWARTLAARARQAGFVVPDQVFGLAWSGAMTAPRVAALIDRLPEGGTEIYVHPATADVFPGHAPGYRYADELAALTDADVITTAERSGAVRGGFMDLGTR
ncbi:hopanoid biosynthesis-associated protein HpnK [Rhodoplanes sp. TEM]|uniref:Hopanoid biosynthesis-associated protein HpnK n=1 Tax=Rhodoplanes tepidamans TaxID=200616 RepID=A0ABT5JDM5_RHOTP|nr:MULTISPECIES: hopanoid biosynthesis-associated protein HpnK [Rhodoplanes]MDC7787709.1 hopanoid biosynthesis-associated protein HpnK [Rhodoplanes tepidamans]MDC7986605.1 hopanoid biosynthesis-associated protein HpnK [Rhodoplanes sp. TEM]MDQ0356465.1 hopanoid biosynthesis associated protein HpnK [Rhodoplanes tepidamans]